MHTPDFLLDRLITGQRFTLEPLRAVLERLGHPERSVPAVLIGGTNGKGSTQAFLASMLRAGGYRVGTFSSPSLADFRELVRIDGAPLPDDAARAMTEEILAAAEAEGLTLFELATALAFLSFSRAGIDLVVVEVGMGGLRDATNLCQPVISILTQVALDHRAELGGTLEAIAAEKVGIARSGQPLITGAEGEALRVILAACAALGTPVDVAGRDFWMESSPRGMSFTSGAGQGQAGGLPGTRQPVVIDGLELGLAGVHQPGNAALAIQAALRLNNLGFSVDQDAIRRGLRAAYVPGRLEWLEGPDGLRVLVDGAHNPNGAEALARSIATLQLPRPRMLAMAVFADKDLEGMLEALLPEIDVLIATRTRAARCLPAEELARRARAVVGPGFTLRVAPDIAVAVAMFRAESAATHLVAGSLSLVEETRKAVCTGS